MPKKESPKKKPEAKTGRRPTVEELMAMHAGHPEDDEPEQSAEEFDLEMAMDTIRGAYLDERHPDREMEANITALQGQVGELLTTLRAAKGNVRSHDVSVKASALREELEDLQPDDPATAQRTVGMVIADFVRGLDPDAMVTQPTKKASPGKDDIIRRIEVAAGASVESARDDYAERHPGDTERYDTLSALATSLNEGRPPKPVGDLIDFHAEAAVAGKQPQTHDAVRSERLVQGLSQYLTSNQVLGSGHSALAQIVVAGIRNAASQVTAHIIGRVGK